MKIAEKIPQFLKKTRKKFRSILKNRGKNSAVLEKICIFATKLNALWKAYTNYSTRN